MPSVIRRIGLVGVTTYWPDVQWENRAHALVTTLNIPQSAAESAIDWRAHHRDAMSNLKQKEVTVALLYAFAKNTMKISRSLKEMCKLTNANLSKTQKYLNGFVIDNGLILEQKKPEQYAASIGQRMGFPRRVVTEAIELIAVRREEIIKGSSPRTIGSAALYIAQGRKNKLYTQEEIAKVAEIKKYSLREESILMRGLLRKDEQGVKVRAR